MNRRICISDIHGCNRSFRALLEQLAPTEDDTIYLLGDYVDRGPDSKGVIDTIFKLRNEGFRVVCLMGNHEKMMLDAMGGHYSVARSWLMYGGLETTMSFNLTDFNQIPEKYITFMDGLERSHVTDEGEILVHAGLNFGNLNPMQDKSAMMWERDWYNLIDYHWLGKRIIVHGHTPTNRDKIEKMLENLEENRYLDIDAGCCYKSREGLGHLCAFDMTSRELIFQPNIDM